MRRREAVRIGDLWGDFLDSSPYVARKIAEAKIPDLWPAMVGSVIASYTTKMELQRGCLTIYMSSSVARHEVFMRRAVIKEEINRLSKMELVRNVIVK